MDTVLVQCLGYGSRRVPLNEVFKESSIHTVCLSLDIQKLGEVVVTGEHAGVSPNVVSRRLSSPEIRNALGTSLATLLERVSGVRDVYKRQILLCSLISESQIYKKGDPR